ncbi:MAG: (d)CMP kinase [Clostridiales bacterium]|nr:(d)CMP kinase [Clostridiales bacterium]
MHMTIAMDGPVGAGKSSVADDVAKALGILHLDTGAMYRAFAWYALEKGVSVEDEAALEALTHEAMPEVAYVDGAQRTSIAGRDVTDLIRTPEVSMATSTASKFASVRKAMVARQQELAKTQDVLLDGRDIGTVVLPDAMLKIYLTAAPEARAQRRYDEMIRKGQETTYEEVLADVIARDEQDMDREVDPLRPAEDAQIVDSTDMNQQQVVENILMRVNMKKGKKPKKSGKWLPLYRYGLAVVRPLMRILFPMTFHNLENVQQDAPAIMISNHTSMLDPVALAMTNYRYHIRFLGKKELMKSPLIRWFFKWLDMIPVDRHNTDMAAIRACMKVLAGGEMLGIFPEGTRHKEGVMEDLESGIALIALRSKAPLLPVYLTDKPRLFHRIHVYCGPVIPVSHLAKDGVNKQNCDKLLGIITARYREMVACHQEQKKNKA